MVDIFMLSSGLLVVQSVLSQVIFVACFENTLGQGLYSERKKY